MKYINLSILIKSLLTVTLAFIAPIQWLILGVIAFIGIDTITGIWKAKNAGESITSKKFGHIISKFVLYNLAILSAFILQQMIGVDSFHIAQIVTVSISLTELKSIAENVNAVTGIDVWDSILNYIKRNDNEITSAIKEVQDGDKK